MKQKIAVRMADGTRRLYVVDAMPLSYIEVRAATVAQVPGAKTVLVEVPQPAPLPLEAA